jgi:hypothetical protein
VTAIFNHPSMDSHQIEKIFSHDPYFIGVYSRDLIPYKFKRFSSGLIMNTDSSLEKGEHWVAVLVNGNKTGEYFDPFGLLPLYKDFINFLDTDCSNKWALIHSEFNILTLKAVAYFAFAI